MQSNIIKKMSLIYSNITRYDNLNFEDYKNKNQFEGSCSFSYLNRERYGFLNEIEKTINMKIGSQVDAIITNPSEVDFACESYPISKRIAHEIMSHYGDIIKVFQKQVSFFGDITHKGYTMRTNGRLDFLIPKHAVIDLKVTQSKDVNALIEFMGYKNQVWHYAKLAGVKKGYILIYSIPLKSSQFIPVEITDRNEFWETKIQKFGTLKNAA